RDIHGSLDEGAVLVPLRVTAVQSRGSPFSKQAGQADAKNVEEFSPDRGVSLVFDHRQRGGRVEKMKEIADGDFRADHQAASRGNDNAHVAARNDLETIRATSWLHVQMSTVVDEQELDVCGSKAALGADSFGENKCLHRRVN